MITGGGQKRTRKQTTKKVTKPFRPPRQADTQIPRLLRSTGTEKKVIFAGSADSINVNGALNTTGTIACVNLIQVGSSMFNRVGRKVQLRSIRLRFYVTTLIATRSVNLPELARITVVYDKQTNGAFPVLADVYQDTEQSGANTSSTLSALNMNNRDRFISIIDKSVVLPSGTITGGLLTPAYPDNGENITMMDEYRKLNLSTYFKADSNPAVIGDIATGALYFICFAGTPAGSELFQLIWNCRIKYVDM